MAQSAHAACRWNLDTAYQGDTARGRGAALCLSNLFLHYVFDIWMTRTFPGIPWCRYADDGLVHCKTEQEAQAIKAALAARLTACGLELHPDKTRIVYCKDGSRKGTVSEHAV